MVRSVAGSSAPLPCGGGHSLGRVEDGRLVERLSEHGGTPGPEQA